jgi:hypothetical protein
VFDEAYILFHFNIILKHNGVPSTKKFKRTVQRLPVCEMVMEFGGFEKTGIKVFDQLRCV